MTLFAKSGEWVTCENGHRICRVARDIQQGELMQPENKLVEWQQPKPVSGQRSEQIRCGLCGAKWFGSHLGKLHFEDGWR